MGSAILPNGISFTYDGISIFDADGKIAFCVEPGVKAGSGTFKMEKKLKREQRKLSRYALLAKKKGINLFEAKNYQKQKRKVARLHKKVMNQRTDFLNKLSTEIIKNHEIIFIEDLNTKGMLHNHKLAKSISDVSWSSFVTQFTIQS